MYFGPRRVSTRGKEYLDKYIQAGFMPSVAPVYRTGKSRSGRPSVLVYPAGMGHGRLTSRKTKAHTSKGRGGKRVSARAYGASYFGARKRRVTMNRRSSKRRSSRRPGLYANRKRRSSKRRSSRRRLTRNLLTTSKARFSGRGQHRKGRPMGKTFQVLMYGSKSKTKGGRRLEGYPVYIPGHVVERASVRRYKRLGGAALDAHRRATTSGYRERKKYPKSRKVTKNGRRRTSMRRNPKYVVVNRRRKSRRGSRKARLRKNQTVFGADLMGDVVKPVLGGTVGFVAARLLSNSLANVDALRGVLDKDKSAAEAGNTKIAANVLGIVATLGLSTKVKVVRDNRGALVTGMGLALADRLISNFAGESGGYLSGFGEYVSQPLGEYVSQPLGAYVNDPSMGEYVSQPLGAIEAAAGMGTMYATAGLGTLYATAGYAEGVDPADQGSVDGLMDTMEAAAGMGTLYATAGLGAEADAELQAYYASQQPPFASIQTPTDLARPVTKEMPYDKVVPTSLVTPEGKGYAGGLFARNLFAGMF